MAVVVADVEPVAAEHERWVVPEHQNAPSMPWLKRQCKLLKHRLCRQVVGWMIPLLSVSRQLAATFLGRITSESCETSNSGNNDVRYILSTTQSESGIDRVSYSACYKRLSSLQQKDIPEML
ncbi:hypothetical protein F2Q68_00024574 [Brassica cretica]|uniref:Uncharacterized protein n=1 Tax=Brassica cretica TaxID=69181 RepID=A0A8S9IHD5_BRACR|nr:hypothetical protein F2Q68_00024574 [Brassica cretica]